MEVVDHPKLGAQMVVRHPWRLSETPPQITQHGPLLGEHNDYVFNKILGIEEQEIARLEEAKVFW